MAHIRLVKSWDLSLFYSLAGVLFSKPYFLHPALSQEQVLVKQAFCLCPAAQRTTTSLARDKEVSVWALVCVAVAEKHRQTERDREVQRKVKASQLLYQVFSQIQTNAETDKIFGWWDVWDNTQVWNLPTVFFPLRPSSQVELMYNRVNLENAEH